MTVFGVPIDPFDDDVLPPLSPISATGTFRAPLFLSNEDGLSLGTEKSVSSIQQTTQAIEAATCVVAQFPMAIEPHHFTMHMTNATNVGNLADAIHKDNRAQLIFNSKVQSWLEAIEHAPLRQVSHRADSSNPSSSLQTRTMRERLSQIRATRLDMEKKAQLEQARQRAAVEEEKLAAERAAADQAAKEAAEIAAREELAKKKTRADIYFEEMEAIGLPIVQMSRKISSISSTKLSSIRMHITRRIGQVTNSRKQIADIVHDLLIFTQKISADGEALHSYALVTICEKIIDQAETQISLHHPSAFPMAQVIVDFGVYQTNFLPLLMYLIMKRCPYAIPRYVAREPHQSETDHFIAMGYLVDDEGGVEGELAYYERMAGIISLYGAITQSTPTSRIANPHGIDKGWNWIARILNMKPEPIMPFIICSFLECAGYCLFQKYGDMFIKVMRTVQSDILSLIPGKSVAGKTRLEIYVNKFFKTAPPSLAEPAGRELLD